MKKCFNISEKLTNSVQRHLSVKTEWLEEGEELNRPKMLLFLSFCHLHYSTASVEVNIYAINTYVDWNSWHIFMDTFLSSYMSFVVRSSKYGNPHFYTEAIVSYVEILVPTWHRVSPYLKSSCTCLIEYTSTTRWFS